MQRLLLIWNWTACPTKVNFFHVLIFSIHNFNIVSYEQCGLLSGKFLCIIFFTPKMLMGAADKNFISNVSNGIDFLQVFLLIKILLWEIFMKKLISCQVNPIRTLKIRYILPINFSDHPSIYDQISSVNHRVAVKESFSYIYHVGYNKRYNKFWVTQLYILFDRK